jgi:lipid-binding SYLF domain-containing protein
MKSEHRHEHSNSALQPGGKGFMKTLRFAICVTCLLCLFPSITLGWGDEVSEVTSSTQVMNEIMSIPEGGIPDTLLDEAQGIAIFPGLLKAGFILGARYGKGIVVLRNQDKSWSNPVFYRLMGGSIGFQIGAQSTDVILVFRTIRSMDAITGGKFTLGADASVAAGPVGRHAEAGTDVLLRAEILSYSRSRGLFAGLSLEGAAIQVDYSATATFYNMPAVVPAQIFNGRDIQTPPAAEELKRTLLHYSGR